MLLAGIGVCTMLAHELSNQLQHLGCQVRLLIAAESVPVSLAKRAVGAVSSGSDGVSGEMLQIWSALYQLIAAAPRPQPFSQPPLGEVIRKLHSLPSYEQQLDYVSTFCPADKTALQWDTEVDAVLARVLHMRQLLLAYQPPGSGERHTVVMYFGDGENEVGEMQMADVQRIADDSWEAVALALRPATVCSIAAGSSGVRAAEKVEALLGCML